MQRLSEAVRAKMEDAFHGQLIGVLTVRSLDSFENSAVLRAIWPRNEALIVRRNAESEQQSLRYSPQDSSASLHFQAPALWLVEPLLL